MNQRPLLEGYEAVLQTVILGAVERLQDDNHLTDLKFFNAGSGLRKDTTIVDFTDLAASKIS